MYRPFYSGLQCLETGIQCAVQCVQLVVPAVLSLTSARYTVRLARCSVYVQSDRGVEVTTDEVMGAK